MRIQHGHIFSSLLDFTVKSIPNRMGTETLLAAVLLGATSITKVNRYSEGKNVHSLMWATP